jgi:type I restriction enzyme M protein
MARRPDGKANGARTFSTPQALNAAIKSICDIMRRSNRAGAIQYVPELTWILFLRILDEREAGEAERAAAVSESFFPSLESPYRWRDWAAPGGAKRVELQAATMGEFLSFVNGTLLPHLKGLRERPNATPRQKVISQVVSGIERVGLDSERSFLDVLDRVDKITNEGVDPTHMFTLSQVYESLLLRMGEKANDGGQFFTPREVIRAMVRAVDPQPGEAVYDPCCGTGGFLAQAFEHARAAAGDDATPDQLDALGTSSFFGKEKEDLIYPIALANPVLHGIDQPNIWHGNTLTGQETYGGLFQSAPALFDVVLTNPPFGGKEDKSAQTNFAYKTSATQVLFLQHVEKALKPGGRCGIVMDEGVLFRTDKPFVQTKRMLLEECEGTAIVSLPAGVFVNAGAGVKTDLLFFTRGGQTDRIWYYDLSDIKVTKKAPLTIDRFDDFFRLLPSQGDSDRSWTVDLVARRAEAAKESAAIRAQAAGPAAHAKALRDEVKALRDEVKALRQEALMVLPAIEERESRAKAQEAEVRALNARAKAAEDAVYDLKAVNPNRKFDEDTRTPVQLLEIIEARGREISDALTVLRSLLVQQAT